MEYRGIGRRKALMIFTILLLFIGGFKVGINNYSFEWVGVLEIVLNLFK